MTNIDKMLKESKKLPRKKEDKDIFKRFLENQSTDLYRKFLENQSTDLYGKYLRNMAPISDLGESSELEKSSKYRNLKNNQ